MAIIGEVLDKYVTDQIKLRQEKLASNNRTSSDLTQFNTNTAWIKLTSAVQIKNTEKFGFYDDIGKEYSLFGGTARNGEVLGGFDAYKQSIFGFEQGYRPAPGIFSFETKNKNRGALRESTITLKAYSRKQFQLIDTLFLRLGFSVLIEFGNSVYHKDSGNLVQAGATDSISNLLFDTTYAGAQEKLLDAIEAKREKTGGNYDGIYGRITNFKWNYTPEGVYDISLTIVSFGDVIESLKANTTPTEEVTEEQKKEKEKKDKQTQEDLDEAETDRQVIAALKNVDVIGRLSYDLIKALNGKFSQTKGQYTILPEIIPPVLYPGAKPYDALKAHNKGDGEDYYYIRLETFLRHLWEQGMLYVNKEGTTPLISILDLVEEPAPIFKTPYTISSNPKLCLIKTKVRVSEPDGGKQTREILRTLPEEASFDTDREDTGDLRNIYFNLAALSKFSYELRDSKNKVAQYDLIKKVLETVESCLGGRNTLKIDVDEKLQLNILDEHPIPSYQKEQLEKADYSLKLFSMNVGSSATTVRDFGIETAITNELASTITIGAQANGSVKGEDATAFSKWNEGLVDRILPIKTNEKEKTQQQIEKEQEEASQIAEKNANIAKEYVNYLLSQQTFDWDSEKADSFATILTDYINFDQSKTAVAENKATGGLGFLPLNLNFTLDGISGLKIYQSIIVDSTFLPTNYGETMQFIITGVSHKLDGNRWTTSIDTNMVPSQVAVSKGNQVLPKATPSTSPGTPGAGPSTPITTPAGSGPVRLKLKRLDESFSPPGSGPDGTGSTTGILQVLDENGNVKFDLPTVELPWKGNQNSISCIPPGTYTFSKSRANNNPGLGDVLRLGPVPYRSGVLVHVGTNYKHTHGCILPGTTQSDFKIKGDRLQDNQASRAAMKKIMNYLYPPGTPASTTYQLQVFGIGNKVYQDSRASKEIYPNPAELSTADIQKQQSEASRNTYIQLVKNLKTIAELQDTIDNGRPLLDTPTDGVDENSQEVGGRLKQVYGFGTGRYSSGPNKGQLVPWQGRYAGLVNSLTKNHRALFKQELYKYIDEIIDDTNFFNFKYPVESGQRKLSDKPSDKLLIRSDNF